MSWLSIQSAHLEVILRVAKKVVLQPENKIKFAEPLFSNLKKKSWAICKTQIMNHEIDQEQNV